MPSVHNGGCLVVADLLSGVIIETLWREILKIEIVSIIILQFPNWLFIIRKVICFVQVHVVSLIINREHSVRVKVNNI